MDINSIFDFITIENIEKILQEYRALGPLAGILITMLEAFLPILPLFLFIVANVNSFGLWGGFLVSWLGGCIGAIIVFLLVRKFGQERFFQFIQKHRSIKKMMNWVEQHGFGPLFIMLCFPFTPAAAVNIVAGLSKISIWQFMLAVCSGKLVMFFMVSFIGYDFFSLIENPIKTVIAVVAIILLWLIGKQIERRLNQSLSVNKGE
ncbi:TVP38/TMEM64 family protein [Bacillus carboniphilus]|uniref:TVP38/TMEM64 family membrane protein n=1 Tax=Bacillus carboniphilus TaxID=86663 RepID=A0ABY9K0W1_9BACI|nr:TVP38/TMEM64 family protein [Bacillus carboniphilus]WLR44223.1 TVP38/TMEM64 family protein [Bacillus carboniphilus]